MEINLHEVKFAYSNSRKPTYDLVIKNLEIFKPELICIAGHTGSGKSTLVQLMNALYKAQEGIVNIDHTVIDKRTKLNPIRKKVGLVFQFPEYQLFEETVIKDVLFGPTNFKLDEPERIALNALKTMGVEDLKDENPFTLSGGQMRKVAIAGILASDPSVLILDEPSAGLDTKSKNELFITLKGLVKNGKTVIVITHDMDSVSKYAERLLVMNKGSLVYDGLPSTLFLDEEKTKEYNLNLPTLYKIMKELNKELGKNMKIDVKNVEEALIALEECK